MSSYGPGLFLPVVVGIVRKALKSSLRVVGAFLACVFGVAPPSHAGLMDAFRDAGQSQVDYTKESAVPAMACSVLRRRTSSEYTVISAELVPASGGVPEHCRVRGLIPSEVQFWVYLPAAWNERFYMHGEGGYAGKSPDSGAWAQKISGALRNNSAVAYTNTGHDVRYEPMGTFALNNPQKEIDYFYRAVHLTALVAKELIGAYYARAPQRSYWDGCSTGGRQGLMEAQRFPADFGLVPLHSDSDRFTPRAAER